MNNKTLYLLVFFYVIFSISVSAQTSTQTVRGIVKDAGSDFPLIGATIQWLTDDTNSVIGTTTDADGRFVLENIPIGRQSFLCTYIGYKERFIRDVPVDSGKETVLTIQLEESVVTLDELVVVARQKGEAINEMAAVSVNTLETAEIMRFSGTFGDVSRMAQNYAGVSGADDSRNDIIVRGNSPSSVLWRMEGIDIPSPNHWSSLGTTGGPISMLNTNNLRSSDFITSAFPAEYGNVTGAVMDINLRNGNSESFEFLGQIGFNGFELGAEGPLGIGKNSSFIANYRYSTLGVLHTLGIDFGTGSSVPQYQDLNFKLNIPTAKIGTFTLWGLLGKSHITFLDNGEENLYSTGSDKIVSKAFTNIVGLSHQYFFTDKTSSNLSFAYSNTESNNSLEKPNPQDTSVYYVDYGIDNDQSKGTINWTLKSKINQRNLVKGGANLDFYGLRVLDSVWVQNSFYFYDRDYVGDFDLFRVFGQWEHKFNDQLTLNTGVNYLYLDLNDSWSLEPRLSLSYDINEKSSIAFGFGRHSQIQPITMYFNREESASDEMNQRNRDLDFYRSDHLVLSYSTQFLKRMKFKAEAYYQKLFDVAVDPLNPTFSAINIGVNFNLPTNVGLVNEGKGTNYGLELTLQQSLVRGFYFMTTTSLFQSLYTGYDQVERNTYFNTNFVFNALLGKEWLIKNKMYFMMDGRFTYSGGRRYTPIDLDASILEGEAVYVESQTFDKQYPAYIRPDIKFGLKRNGKNVTHTFSVDLLNFINRQNIYIEYYNVDAQKITTLYQRGLFPDVRYQILF